MYGEIVAFPFLSRLICIFLQSTVSLALLCQDATLQTIGQFVSDLSVPLLSEKRWKRREKNAHWLEGQAKNILNKRRNDCCTGAFLLQKKERRSKDLTFFYPTFQQPFLSSDLTQLHKVQF